MILAPWKTASSTMRARLGHFCDSPYPIFPDLNPHLARIATQHMTRREFDALPESRLGYFTAAFVRNPYDRVYSGFRQLQRDMKILPYIPYTESWVRDQVLKALAEIELQLTSSSFDFDNWIMSLAPHHIREIDYNICFPLHPAHYWTHHNGVKAVDFIGKVEDFEKDFVSLCTKFGLENWPHVNANVDYDIKAASHPDGYKYVHLMSAPSIARIGSLFHEDFELFGYPRLI